MKNKWKQSYRKYSNTRTKVDGYTFDSVKEASRYYELKMLQKAGKISTLILQPSFELQEGFTDRYGKKQRAITYRGDFQYFLHIDGNGYAIVEDVKGMKTDIYKLKKKMFLKLYPQFDLREV